MSNEYKEWKKERSLEAWNNIYKKLKLCLTLLKK